MTQSNGEGGPKGRGAYVVRAGDCIHSIAAEHGLTADELWNDDANSDLKSARVNPSILLPGDLVTIPARRRQRLDLSAGTVNRYSARPSTVEVRMTLSHRGEAWKNTPFVAVIDGRRHEGTTDGDGVLKIPVEPTSRGGLLTLRPADKPPIELELALGHLVPSSEIAGIQMRLAHLGYRPGRIDGVLGPMTRAALEAFQTDQGIDASGDIDDNTRSSLENSHGC